MKKSISISVVAPVLRNKKPFNSNQGATHYHIYLMKFTIYLMDPLLVPRLIIKTRLRSGNSCRNNSKRENKVFYTRM